MRIQSGAGRGGTRRLILASPAFILLAASCAAPRRLSAVPVALTIQAQPLVANARYWPHRDPAPLIREALSAVERERAWSAQSGHAERTLPPAAYLAISGGGDNGAFAAGLLAGWTERGDRPSFKVATGVSTGALIAPFAFLGARYDPALRANYTEISQRNIFTKRAITAALFGDAMANTQPMANLIRHSFTRALLDEIAAEYAKGRLLLVGTTNLDAREPVIWNMTAIAASKDPGALDLFQKILIASASIPGAFPPVMIDVTADGRRYQEMHVDGGATRQVFLYPPSLHLGERARQAHIERRRSLYIVQNGRLDPEWASVDRRTLSIANRAVSSLIQTQGIGDLDRLFYSARRDGIDYNLAFIPKEFNVPHRFDFDTNYMRQLFEYGRSMAAQGYPWLKYPPGYGPEER